MKPTTLVLLLLAGCDGPAATLRVEPTSPDGAARVYFDPGHVVCGLPCEAEFTPGVTVNVTIEPAARSRFVRWGMGNCGPAPSCSVVLDSDVVLGVELEMSEPGVVLSDTDTDPGIVLREDRLAAALYEGGAVRSTHSVAPGSGVAYFEAHPLGPTSGLYGFGVATAEAPLLGATIGMTDQSFGMSADGVMTYANAVVGRTTPANTANVGFVVDYRGAMPTVHVLAPNELGEMRVLRTQQMSVSTPLYVYIAGQRRSWSYEVEINTGNDTTNFPFVIDAGAVLNDAGLSDVAGALTPGFGMTYAGEPDAPPSITAPGDRSAARGESVTLHAEARDAEDGDLSDAIVWELLSGPHFDGTITSQGASFTFTADAVGIHPVRLRVRDTIGHVVETTMRVTVPGPVTMVETMRLEHDELAGPGIQLRDDALAAHWTAPGKNGVRANQSLYGEFWYFEFERLHAPINQGGGIVIGAGNLGPYSWADTPPSMSVNTLGGVFRNLQWQSNFPASSDNYTHFGLAVDYRGEHPTVYVIAGNAVIAELFLDDVWVEVYPMIYGNPTGDPDFDEAIHLAPPFEYDPRAALTAYRVDAAELVVGWGR